MVIKNSIFGPFGAHFWTTFAQIYSFHTVGKDFLLGGPRKIFASNGIHRGLFTRCAKKLAEGEVSRWACFSPQDGSDILLFYSDLCKVWNDF